MYKFDFSNSEMQWFMDNCSFTDEEKTIMEMRRNGKSLIEITLDLNMSERTISRKIKSIIHKIVKALQ